MREKRKQSLMDLLLENAFCSSLSDLRNITEKERLRLADKLKAIVPDDYPLPVGTMR